MVPPAFAIRLDRLKLALTGEPGSLTVTVVTPAETFRNTDLRPALRDGGDFIAWPAASHRPAALWKVTRILVSVLNGVIIPEA